MVRYRCTPPEVEYYVVMSCGVSYVVICALVLLLLLTRKSNLFRLACLLTVCSELTTILSAMVSCSTSNQSPLEKHALQMAVMLVKWTAAVLFDVALLRHGRSYRPAGLRNTRLFIITAIVIIAASLLMVPFLVFYRMSSTAAKYATVYSVIQYLVTSTRYLAFLLSILYAFFPMFAIHGVGNSQSPHYSIDARTAAFGTYYMIVAFLWFIFIVSFDIVTTSKVSVMKRYAHVAFFISAFMNSTASLALGLQAPYSFVERLRRSILGRTINRVVIVERGVLSTGILEGKVYESPL